MATPIEALADTGASDRPRTPSRDTPVSASAETQAADSRPPGSRGRAELAGPTKIGRYVLLELLGEGGMGVVLAAYDPKLDRKVAIKLIHALRRDDGERRLRMEREAQAMARLSHPNVVTVYEVGEHEEQLFVAMEFVKGQTLRGWLAERGAKAGWRGALDLFLQAGQGLAAAHRAGLVHRDFKPDNVFVGEDGRVRVGDFGLARQESEAGAELVAMRAQAQAPDDASALARELTVAGAMLGTPGYMAPEQLTGEPTDARTDQFAFCVALWEALYGQRPFAAPSLRELIVQVTRGNRRPPPPGRSVPAWLRRRLERGLAVDPVHRFPSMDALLAALRADPTRRRWALAGVATLALALAGGVGLQRRSAAQQVAACEAEGASIAEVWNDDVQRSLDAALRRTGAANAATIAERVAPYLAAQAGAWKQGRTEACLNARVRGAWDEDTRDRSQWCLDERRMELAALIAELSQASAASVQHAISAAAKLSPLEPCLDPGRLRRLPAPPQDREDARAIQATLLQSDAKRAAGSYAQGLALADDALARAEEFGWPPLVAAARSRRGASLEKSGRYEDAEAALKEGYYQAAESGAWEVAASAAQGLIHTVGYQRARYEEGQVWWRLGEISLDRLGVEPQGLLRATSLSSLASVHFARGEYAEARSLHMRALAIRERALGPDHLDVAASVHNLANVHKVTGELAEARALYGRALTIREQALGPDHPDLAASMHGLASVYRAPGERDAARSLHAQALAIREAALGPDHPDVAHSLHFLANVHLAAGRHAEAGAMHARAAAIRERSLGPDHPDVATSRTGVANAHLLAGEHEEAGALYERVLAVQEQSLGPDHLDLAVTLNNLALVRSAAGRLEAAGKLHARALAIREAALGPDHPDVRVSLRNLADVHEVAGRPEEARKLRERARALEPKTSPDAGGR